MRYKLLYVWLCMWMGILGVHAQHQNSANSVNVFLGSSGDYGQLSPAASSPFSSLSIGPHTYPFTHTGYEYLAKDVYGFTHNRFEGVGCQGSGGVMLLKPLQSTREQDISTPLEKVSDTAKPGRYEVEFTNGLQAAVAVHGNSGVHQYRFAASTEKRGLYLDLAHSFNRAFVSESHQIEGQLITGTIRSKTTCHVGIYTIYYALYVDQPVDWEGMGESKLRAVTQRPTNELTINIRFSAVSEADARQSLQKATYPDLADQSLDAWQGKLNRIEVQGDKERVALFYSLLYRTLQSPYKINSESGEYRAIDGSLQQSPTERYNGWAIWDNYKTQLPLLSVAYPEIYQPIVHSIANLYPYGKKDYATQHEPSNTVRTEHAIVVLLDAYRKGYDVDFAAIVDSVRAEVDRLDVNSPDKALETAYDYWALAQIYEILDNTDLHHAYTEKALAYRKRWSEEFADLSRSDVDRMSARKMYQGTIRQYRWSVPFDIEGLKQLIGGEDQYVAQLDDFFDNNYFNRANEPDLHVPSMYQASQQPWKSQLWMHKLAVDTVINHYFNDNSRGIGSEIDVIFKNQPKAFIRTMDDDAGAMSGWFIWAGLGLYPAAVGHPIYYIHLPLFEDMQLHISEDQTFSIKVVDYGPDKKYVQKVLLNGRQLDRNWLTHEEIAQGGELVVYAASDPNPSFGIKNQWSSKLK